MARSYKLQFHNGEADEKPIVTFTCAVNHTKRFDALDTEGKRRLLANIKLFEDYLSAFKTELEPALVTST